MNLTDADIMYVKLMREREVKRQKTYELLATLATGLIVIGTVIFVIGTMPLIISNHKAVPLWVW